jgi:carbon-monoxide dehydrogenase medium subunit
MTLWKNYHTASSIDDALRELASSNSPSRLIAGGTDFLLDLQQGRHASVETLVDVSGIPALRALEIRSGKLFIGAAVPLSQIIQSPYVFEHAQALVEACALIGGPQVRNVATLGGNVTHALPAADGSITLMALNAGAEVADINGHRRILLRDLYSGPGISTLKPDRELLVGFHLPLKGDEEASAFKRVMRPQGVALPILNMAVWMQRKGDAIRDLRIAIGPGGPTPTRAIETENFIRNNQFTEALISQAVEILSGEIKLRTSKNRATKEYRHHLSGLLLRDTLSIAWDRAK